jgi:hypothetical protein
MEKVKQRTMDTGIYQKRAKMFDWGIKEGTVSVALLVRPTKK